MKVKHTEKQSNIQQHDKTEFENIVEHGLTETGICLIAMKNWGKSRFLMNTCAYIQSLPNVKNYIFDSSDAFLYGFNRIPVFNINENDVQLKEIKTTLDIESYEFVNWQFVKLALETYPKLLFRLKSKSPSKKGFAIRSICNYLDDLQRQEKELSPTHENKYKIAYTIDEFSSVFSNRSTLRTNAEVFMSTYAECRNFSESFWFSLLREIDGAKTLRVKALNAYGKIPECDKTPYHRRLERQYNVNLSNMQPRTWLIEGKTIVCPEFKQQGKPYIINQAIREKWFSRIPKQEPTKEKEPFLLKFMKFVNIFNPIKGYGEEEIEENEKEEEKDDALLLEDSYS